MRVALGVHAGTLGGPRSYGLGLLRALATEFPEDRWIAVTDRPDAVADVPGVEVAALSIPARVLRPAVEALLLPRLLRRLAPDLYHGTKHSVPARMGFPVIATIHDLAYEVLPETFGAAAGAYLRRETRWAVTRARRLVVPSASTARDLERLLGVERERIVVVPNGVADAFHRSVDPAEVARVRTAHGLPDRFIVCVGTLQPRKNPEVLLDAFLDLRTAGLDPAVGLVFAGRRGWRIEGFLRRVGHLGAAAGVRLLEDVPDGDIPPLLAAAEVFASPTSYEGFGLSIAEAMAVGTPVVAGDGSSVPEVVGDAGILVPPRDRAGLGAALRTLLDDAGERSRLGAAGRARAAAFTWSAAARAIRRVYAEATA